MTQKEKRIITKQFLKKHGFEYLERFGFWYKHISFSRSYDGLTFRYRYEQRILETQRSHVIGGEDTIYHTEEEGYKLINAYIKEGIFHNNF